jgi:hypothetical protein
MTDSNKSITTQPRGYFKLQVLILVYYDVLDFELNKIIVDKQNLKK